MVTWEGIEFGGFVSQGYLKSSANDYLGKTSDGSFDFREYAVSASWAKGPWRIGAQAFAQKLGIYGNDEIKLDWAAVDYQAAQWFGIRAGRVKMPRGLYNEALDLDSVRPFVLLPQSIYDPRMRDFSAAFDGAMAYGNVGLKQAGNLDYKLFYGKKTMSNKSGASDYFNIDAPYPNLDLKMDDVWGASLFWNTPVQGLRIGYSFSRFDHFMTHRYNPKRLTDVYKEAPTYDRHILSIEYTHGDWTFATEGGFDAAHYELTFPSGYKGYSQTYYGRLDPTNIYLYASASRRINSWLELGTYYSYSHWKQDSHPQPGITIPTFPVLNQGDFALSARFDVNEHLLFKLEFHEMNGAGSLFNLPTDPANFRDTLAQHWAMFAAKMTVTF